MVGFSCADFAMTVSRLENRGSLQELLSKSSASTLFLGTEMEGENSYYSLSIFMNGESSVSLLIGLIAGEQGYNPQTLLLPDCRRTLIGLNTDVIIIDCISKNVLTVLPLPSLFFRFIHVQQHNLILVLHELGVVAVTSLGKEIWSYDKDIVTGWELNELDITLRFWDCDNRRFRVADGARIALPN